MSRIEGRFFDGRSSKAYAAVLTDGRPPILTIEELGSRPLSPAELQVSERIGNLPRTIQLGDGASFEAPDSDQLEHLLRRARGGRRGGLVHALESRWRYTLLGLVLVVILGGWLFVYGIPAIGVFVANRLPDIAFQTVGNQTLSILDEQYLQDSELDAGIRQRLEDGLHSMVKSIDWSPGFRLLFRRTPGAMANAFALPDGTLIVTDELVHLAEDDSQVLAVLAHEVGHVLERHGMQKLVQSSLIVFAGIMVTGDTSGMSATALGFPVLLLELSYSRDFERAADRFAVDLLARHGIDPRKLARVLERLDTSPRDARRHGDAADAGFDYLSTHPATTERLRDIERQAAAVR